MRPLPVPANDDPPAVLAALLSRGAALRVLIEQTRTPPIRDHAVAELAKVNARIEALRAEMAATAAGLRRQLWRNGVRPEVVAAP